ncbi:UvrD-helicase domain-containing protein [Planctomicrobium sp. SH527]|uniref:UvrD-helicase domain-containing protein n=1 Tax=Planctomicrobium sp. SH527 TaxID=3448123 RepID=UPI003F5B1E5B
MAELSAQQAFAIQVDGDVFVTACPGSGKTRVLSEKIIATLDQGISPHQRTLALTYTNRAADEVAARLQEHGYSKRHLWTGTIHSFALEWILRPYASYDPLLQNGFSVIDEAALRKLVDSLRGKHGVDSRAEIRMGFLRNGQLATSAPNRRSLIEECREKLKEQRLLDFDHVLYLAFDLLRRKPEIAATLGAIFSLICVDEYQDTQDLQFGILASIVRASNGKSRLFIVGDKNQAIYSSLGGIAKTVNEIRHEFGRPDLSHHALSGNYRSTQRIVDFCANFCEAGEENVVSLAHHASERGLITFADQTFHHQDIAQPIAKLIRYHLSQGLKPENICILGPSWWLLTKLGRQLVLLLPDVDFDAPGLSPIRYEQDSFWFKLARLFLTEPSPTRFRTRLRWAADFVTTLEAALASELPEEIRNSRAILRLVNDLTSVEESGLAYLDDVFDKFFAVLELDLALYPFLLNSRTSFFESAEERLIEHQSELEPVATLRKMFRQPSGIIFNSCHGAKGEEYEVVICFGLLRGQIPNWARIIDNAVDDEAESRRLLYVIASRAKKYLHLFAEDGRRTRNQTPYETTREAVAFDWDYDELPL